MKKILIICLILFLLPLSYVLGGILKTIPAHVEVLPADGILVYWDYEHQIPMNSVDFGQVQRGNTAYVTISIVNSSNTTKSLYLTTNDSFMEASFADLSMAPTEPVVLESGRSMSGWLILKIKPDALLGDKNFQIYINE